MLLKPLRSISTLKAGRRQYVNPGPLLTARFKSFLQTPSLEPLRQISPTSSLLQNSPHRSTRSLSSSSSSSSSSSTPNHPAQPPEPTVTTSLSPIPNHPTLQVATITLNNPHKLNTVTTPLLNSLLTALNSLPTSPTSPLRAVILTSAPPPPPPPPTPSSNKQISPSFIGGASIPEMSTLTTPKAARTFITTIHALNTLIRFFPVPVIARAHGHCLGAGLEILASCDLRLATRVSTFAMPEVCVGIPSVVEARLLPGLIGWGRARRMMLLGETIDARTAEKWGLIDECCADVGELDDVVGRMVERLAGNGAAAVREQKRLMRAWEDEGVTAGIGMGIDSFAATFDDGGAEPREMMGRFFRRKR